MYAHVTLWKRFFASVAALESPPWPWTSIAALDQPCLAKQDKRRRSRGAQATTADETGQWYGDIGSALASQAVKICLDKGDATQSRSSKYGDRKFEVKYRRIRKLRRKNKRAVSRIRVIRLLHR